MRSTLLRLAFALAIPLVACGPGLAEIAVGDAAPAFQLQDLDGKQVSLADFRGKRVVLEWMNPNCPFSRRHSDNKTMQSTATKHADAVWLAINSTTPNHADHLDVAAYKKFLADEGISYSVLLDPTGETGKAYGARTTPHMFIIDGEGKVAYAGAIDDDPRGAGSKVNHVDAALAALESGKAPEPASTRPYGCSVKY
jgi:peroxiredoxin